MLLAYSFTQSVGTRVPLSCRRYERTNERSPFFVGGISREANLNPATRTARTDARTDGRIKTRRSFRFGCGSLFHGLHIRMMRGMVKSRGIGSGAEVLN